MSTNLREVCLEIFVNGVFHSCDSFWVPEEEDAQLEFRITDAIHDLFGSSAVITAQLEVDTPEDMSVSYSVVQGDAVQVDFDMNHSTSACVERDEQLENEVKHVFSVLVPPTEAAGTGSSSGIDASLETHENSPTESTKEWMMKKTSGVFQMLFAVPEPLSVPVIPQPTSETDLVDIEQSSVPVPRVSEQEPQVDLVDPEDSSVSGLNRSEPEPVSSEGEGEFRDAISDLKSPTLVCDDLSDSTGSSGSSRGIDQDGMDAPPETPEKISPKGECQQSKISAFLLKLFRIDPAVPEPLCLPDASVPEPEPELDLVDPKESCVPVPSVPELEPQVDLVDPEDSSVSGLNRSEPEPVSSEGEGEFRDAISDLKSPTLVCDDLSDSTGSSGSSRGIDQDGMDAPPETPEKISPKGECQQSKISAFLLKLFRIDPAVPEPLCLPDASVPEPEPELDLVDPKESCVPVPSVPELEPQVDLVDPEDSSVSGLNRSEPEPVSSEGEGEFRDAISDLKSRTLVCDDLSDSTGSSGSSRGIDQDGMDAPPETPGKISPKESTTVSKISAFLLKLFRIDPAVPEPLCLPDASVPEPEPELDLVDPKESCVPVPSVPEPEPELDLVDPKESCVPVPSVPELEPQVDLVDPEDSSVSGLNRSEPEPVSSEGEGEFRDAISDLKSPTLVCDDLSDSTGSSGSSRGIDQDGMDAPPETPGKISPKESTTVSKISAFLLKLFRIDPAVPEPLCLPDASVPEPEPELDLVDPKESCVPVPSVPEPEPELDLVDPKESCVPVPSVPEPEPQVDLVDSEDSSVSGLNRSEPEPVSSEGEGEFRYAISDLKSPTLVCDDLSDSTGSSGSSRGIDQDGMDAPPETPEKISPKESTTVSKISAFLLKLFRIDPAVPEPLCLPDASVPEPEPELDLVDPKESCVPVPSVPEPEPELDLVDPEDSSVSGLNRSEPEPVSSEGEFRDAISDLKSPTLVCDDLSDSTGSSGSSRGIDQGGMDAPPETPEKISPKGECQQSKISAFLLKLFRIDPAVPEPLCLPDASVPEPEPELDLVDPKESCVPVPSVPELEPQVDLVDSEDSSVSGLNRSEPEPVSSEGEGEFRDAISDLKSPTLVCDDLSDSTGSSGSSRGIDQDGMDAPPETPGKISPKESTTVSKISAFLLKLFRIDPAVPEPLCLPDASVPEPEPELDLVDPEDSSVSGLNRSEPEPVSSEGEFRDAISDLKSPTLVCDDLSDSTGSSGSSRGIDQGGMDAPPETPEKISPKGECQQSKISAFLLKLFRIDPAVPEPLCLPDASVPEPEPELDLVDPKESFVPVPSVPEPEPELDLVDSDESCVPVPSVPEPEPELDLVDSDESCVPVPSVPEPEPELDLVDSEESCVPGPSVPYACSSEQKLVKEETCFLLEERVKGGTQHQNPVTVVWNNIFIGNEEIARDRMTLKELGITHILNAAAVKKKLRVLLGVPWETDLRETVDTGARYYRGMNITYCGLPTTQSSNISKYFLPAAKFIHKARKNPENKVFIHCTDGVSYAPTLFLAYLMIHHYMTVEEAIDDLIQVRYIKPDIDSLEQLAILNEDLVHNTATKYRRENNSWIYKQAAKILKKNGCRSQIKRCARIKRRCTLFRSSTY